MRRSWAATAAVLMFLTIGGVPAVALQSDPSGPSLPRCPAGTDPDRAGAIEQQRPPVSYWAPAVFDPATDRIIVFPTGADSRSVDAWAFDVCTNSWSTLGSDSSATGPSNVQSLAADIDLGVLVGIGDGQTWTYDPARPGWDARGPLPTDGIFRLAYDPVSDRVLARTSGWGQPEVEAPMLWSVDPRTGAWTEIRVSGDIPVPEYDEYLLLATDPRSGMLVAYDAGSGRTWRLDPDSSTWSEAGQGPALRRIGWMASGGEVAVAEAAGLIVFYSDELVLGYDPVADAWQVLYGDPDAPFPSGPLARIGHFMVYDPVNERLVVMGGQAFTGTGWVDEDGDVDGWSGLDDVWAFDTATRQWMQLLAPSSPPSAAGDGAAWGEVSRARIEYAPTPTVDPSLVPDADGFIFEEVAPGVRRLVTDGAGHFPSATYIREARDMDRLMVDDDGRVLVWSTTHGADNELFDQRLWVLGVEGSLSGSEEPSDLVATERARLAPDGGSWSIGDWPRGGGVIRSHGETVERFLASDDTVSLVITPDGRVWVAVGHDDGESGGIYVIEPEARGEPIDPAVLSGTGTVPSPTSGSAITVSSVTLEGEPFFVRATAEPDMRRCAGLVVDAGTVVDGEFLPESQCWDEGAVWWEDANAFRSSDTGVTSGHWIELELAGTYRLDGVIVQADDNDAYLLSYRDPDRGTWSLLWTVPPAYGFGMTTRPAPFDRALMQVLAGTVTDAVRFEADSGDGMYSVSEIQLFGEPVAD